MSVLHNILCIDVGTKRVGVSIARGEVRIAIALDTYPRANGEAEKAILSLIQSEKIEEVVIGIPLDEEDKETSQAKDVKKFAARLSKRTPVKLTFLDEYGSSSEAKQRLTLGESPSPEARRSGVIDALSASIVLQQYLDSLGK